MNLKDWSKLQGICYHTALRWFHKGKLPVPATQTETGTILVGDLLPQNDSPDKEVVIYGRVSSHDQKEDLERQLHRLRDYASASGLTVNKEISEIGSGLNGRRPKLIKLLEDNKSNILVEHKDRLCRFGFEYIEASLLGAGRKIIVMNNTEDKTDIVQDFIDIVTSMCSRIYGKRSARNRANRAIKAASE